MVRRGDWTRAAELNLLDPDEWRRPLRVLVTRLSTYEDTSLSVTHHYLYALISALGYYPDRAFLPPARDEALWSDHGVPWLVGVQSHRSAEDFGLVAISNAVVQEMGNLLWFLRHSGFPLSARERRGSETWPLVILGGANAPFSSLLWEADSPLDGIFAGEDRQAMERLFHTVARGRADGRSKADILGQLASIPGFLVPGSAERVMVRPSKTVLDPDLLAAMPVALGEGNAGKAALAISAGCAGFCAFCAESWTRKPYVEAPVDGLVRAALKVKVGQGADRLDVMSFNFNMHAGLYPFLEGVIPLFSGFGLKSQRFDSLAVDPGLLEVEKLLGKTWFTCGLEGISDRMRRVLNKNLNRDQLRRAFAVIARSGVRELKVFLIATGEEQDGDFQEFAELLAWLRTLPGPRGQPLRAVFSITPLVRFPLTPLEFQGAPDPKQVDKAARHILRTAKEAGFEGRVAASTDEAAVCDLMLRPPGSDLYESWSQTVLEGGFVYRDEIPTWFLRHWKVALERQGWTSARLAGAYGIENNRQAPWSRLQMGVERTFLERQYLRNQAAEELTPGGLIRTHAADPGLIRRWTEAEKHRRAAEVSLSFLVHLGPRAVSAGRDQAAAALAQALMQESETLARSYRGFRGSHWSPPGAPCFCGLEGDDWFELVFLPEGLSDLESWSPDSEAWSRINRRFSPFGAVKRFERGGASSPGPWTVEIRAPWRLDGKKYLTDRGLKHVFRQERPGRWIYELPAASLKKDWIKSLESRELTPGAWSHLLVPGTKWDWRTVLDEGFAYPPEGGPSQVRLIAFEGSLPPR